ncbi:MAG TPA: HipA domain-containing protein [Dermatophilaceae bacterium]|nr:HipA domain-containing protein [Dermatophilaceae bacterium]
MNSDLEQLYRRIVFSILTGNTDDHLRNHGFVRAGRAWAVSRHGVDTGVGVGIGFGGFG